MTPLPKAGFAVVRRESRHVVLRRPDPFAQATVPDHDELDRGTVRAIIRQADLSVEEFVGLLGRGRRG